MRLRSGMLGEVSFDDVLSQWQTLSATARDGLIIFSAFTVVTGSIFVWAMFIRKPKRRHHSHHRSHRSSSSERTQPIAGSEGDGESSERRRRKWRRPRRDHRPRNPTLAETGGLPPVRGQDSSEPQF